MPVNGFFESPPLLCLLMAAAAVSDFVASGEAVAVSIRVCGGDSSFDVVQSGKEEQGVRRRCHAITADPESAVHASGCD
ncbi:hypothetical protein Misp03_36380 [Microbispora sp. NBRC 16548]|nr:hypothetical protein Misp03_36380 [Microbispora sp. NBRC 16548]